MAFRRLAAVAFAVSALIVATFAARAADLPTAKPAPAPPAPVASPWSFTITSYGWLPTVTSKANLSIPGGGAVSKSISVSPGDYLPDLRFGFMGAAEVDYGRFALLTDILYTNLGLNLSAAHFGQINGPGGVISVPYQAELSLGSGVGLLAWTAAGGYSLSSGPWGEIKGLAGFRLLNLTDQTYYSLNASIPGLNSGIALSQNGGLSLNQTYVYGIVGATGRFNLSNSGFFVPYEFDVGTGSTPLTWNGFAGIGYRFSKFVDLSLGYRYLSFENSSGKSVEYLNLGGAIATAALHF